MHGTSRLATSRCNYVAKKLQFSSLSLSLSLSLPHCLRVLGTALSGLNGNEKNGKECVRVVFFPPSTDFDNQVNIVVSILKRVQAIV